MEEKSTENKTHMICDSCRSNDMICSGTLPCDNCFTKQSSSSIIIKCTYNEDIKNRLNRLNKVSNKFVYSSINEKMNKLQSIISGIDYSIVDNILNEAIRLNNYNVGFSNKKDSLKRRRSNDESQAQDGNGPQLIKTLKDSTKILKMGINVNNTSTPNYTNSKYNKPNTPRTLELGSVFLGEEGQLDQCKSSFKLFYYLNPYHLKNLIPRIKSNSIGEYTSSIDASEVLFTLNALLQKDNDIYVENLFRSDFDLQFHSQEIMKISTKIMDFIKPKVFESNDFFFIRSQRRVTKLYDLFEKFNADTDDNEYIKMKGKMTISEMNLIFTILLNNITLYKNEKEHDILFFEELVLTETVLLKYVIDFYKKFTVVSRKSDNIENNVYNIQSLLQFAFYLENSPSPKVSARIISSCISYIQLLHYNDSDYINQLLPNEELEYPETLKFQIRTLYLTTYMYDKTISLRSHKPDFLYNKDEVFTIMNHHTRDLLKYYNYGSFLNKDQLSSDKNAYINILDSNTELYKQMIKKIDGSNIIIQHLKLRVNYLHSLAYKYLIAAKNENDSIEITLQKKSLVLDNLHTFKVEVKNLFGITELDQAINIVFHINKRFSNCDTITKVKLAWKYIVTAIEYYTLNLVIHLADLETLHHVETEKDISKASRYCENPIFLKAIEDCLETSVYAMEFNGLHKYESSSVLFCTLVAISSAFNVCIFNQKFFDQNKELMIKLIRLVTKTASKKGFIDTLKWSAVSVLGMSIMKILFELNSYDDVSKALEFKVLFKDEYVETVEILKQASKMILHALDTKRFKEYVKQSKIYNSQREVKDIYHSNVNDDKMIDIFKSPYDGNDNDFLEPFNLQLPKEDMDNLNIEIESFMDKEIMKLLSQEINEPEERKD